MTKACSVQYNTALNRWEAVFANRILASCTDKVGGVQYLKRVIEGGFSKKAANFGVTQCTVVEEQRVLNSTVEQEVQTVEQEFSINERFGIVEHYVDMVAQRELASTLVTGEGGLGKSYTVLKALRDSGLQDISEMSVGAKFGGARGYVIVKGYSTAKGLYRTLYENRHQVIVFDDCDSVLKDPTAVNILKAALDSYEKRMISWNAESWGDDDLPRSFEFSGGIIFISNMSKHKVPQPIRTRAMCADVGMTRAEVLDRMNLIVQTDEFMPEFETEHKLDAIEFIAEHLNNPAITELNLRSLVNVVKARHAKPDHWKRLGLYSLMNA